MKTTTEHIPNEATKRLFRQLFETQYELERYADCSDPQIAMIISDQSQKLGRNV